MSGVEGAAVKSAFSAARPVGSWLWRRWRPDVSSDGLDAVLRQLAVDMQRLESDRLDELQVPYHFGIPVRFGRDGSIDDVAAYYRGVKSGRLVFVGKAGAGKTVIAMHLLLDLLNGWLATDGPSARLPIRVNAAGWDGNVGLTDFLIEKLTNDYDQHPRVAAALVNGRRLLPIIDGLDEMDVPGGAPERAASAVQRLNEPPWTSQPLVVTCRTGVYEQIRSGLDNVGIQKGETTPIRALTTNEIENYVQARLDEDEGVSESFARNLEPVLTVLDQQPTGALSRALDNPWMLALTLTYLNTGDSEAGARLVKARDDTAITDLLFGAQIPAACAGQARRGTERKYGDGEVSRWLTNLARHLERRSATADGSTEIALHEIWLLAGYRRTRQLHGTIAGPLVGLGAGLAIGSFQPAAVALPAGVIAVAFGLLGALQSSTRPERVILRTHRKGALGVRVAGALRFGFALGFFFGIAAFLFMLLFAGLHAGLIYGAAALLYGLIFGGLSMAVMNVPADMRPPRDGAMEIHDDIVAGVFFGSLGVLTVWLVLGVGYSLATGHSSSLSSSLTSGLTMALVLALSIGLSLVLFMAQAAVRYWCAALVFRRTGAFAPSPVSFFGWATSAGLLRITGTRYQFRHETYRRWLIAQQSPSSEQTSF